MDIRKMAMNMCFIYEISQIIRNQIIFFKIQKISGDIIEIKKFIKSDVKNLYFFSK